MSTGKGVGFIRGVVKVEHRLDRRMIDFPEQLRGFGQAVDHVGLVMPEGLEENLDSAPPGMVGDAAKTLGEMASSLRRRTGPGSCFFLSGTRRP